MKFNRKSAPVIGIGVISLVIAAVLYLYSSGTLDHNTSVVTTPGPKIGSISDRSGGSSSGTSTNGSMINNLSVSQANRSTSLNWPMYHHDITHAGSIPLAISSKNNNNNNNHTIIRGDWLSQNLDGAIYAEPLVEGKRVFVATENDSIYSLNAESGAVNWRVHVGSPVPGASLPCGNIDPSGITGTPVIDQTTRTIYAVAFVVPIQHELFAVDIDTGKILFQHNIDPEGSNPAVEQQRAALTLANGMVYVSYGGLWGDCGNYHGWVVGIKTDGTGPLLSYQVPTQREGGLWAPSGAVVDFSGYLYVTSGNGESTSIFDHGNSVIKLSPSLQEAGFFAPSNWAELNGADADLGSVGPAIVGKDQVFQIGKEGVGYLIDIHTPGGVGGQIFSGKVCAGAYGGTAYSSPYLYVPCTDGLFVVRIANGSFNVVSRSEKFNSGAPIITGELVWAVDTSSATLHAFNVTNGQEIFKSSLESIPRFTSPSSGDGRIFVAASVNKIASFLVG